MPNVCVCVCVCVRACVRVCVLVRACVRVWGHFVCGHDFIYFFFLNYPMKMKSFSVTETKLFTFIGYLKTGGGGVRGAGRGLNRVGLSKPPEPHLDPPLDRSRLNRTRVTQLFWLYNSLWPEGLH